MTDYLGFEHDEWEDFAASFEKYAGMTNAGANTAGTRGSNIDDALGVVGETVEYYEDALEGLRPTDFLDEAELTIWNDTASNAYDAWIKSVDNVYKTFDNLEKLYGDVYNHTVESGLHAGIDDEMTWHVEDLMETGMSNEEANDEVMEKVHFAMRPIVSWIKNHVGVSWELSDTLNKFVQEIDEK